MSENPNYNYEMENEKEELIINNIIMTVLPSDILAFTNNSVLESTFIRSKSVFSVRSKYAKGKIILNIPISIDFTSDDENAIASREQGFSLLVQANNFPFLFIKSNRIYSYISDKARKSSTGYMMFAVDELKVVHDVNVQDILFLELSLIYCDHTSQTADFDFLDDPAYPDLGVKNLYDSKIFNDFVDNLRYKDGDNNSQNIYEVFGDLQEYFEDKSKNTSTVAKGALPFSKVIMFAPQVLSQNDPEAIAIQLAQNEQGNTDEAFKEIKITSQNGDQALTAAIMQKSNGREEDTASGTYNLDFLYVVHKAFHDLELGGDAAITRVVCSRKNKLATHFIGGHQNPFIQYMGRYPARVEMSLTFNNKECYKTQMESTIAALNSMSSIISYNNSEYPEISAYNTLKIKSLVSAALDITNIIPNQTSIQSSSTSQGLEELNITFIESNMEEFMKVGNVINGRNVSISAKDRDLSLINYLKSFVKSGENTTETNYTSITGDIENPEIHKRVLQSLYSIYGVVSSEFSAGSSVSDTIQARQNNGLESLEKFPEMIDKDFLLKLIGVLRQRSALVQKIDSQDTSETLVFDGIELPSTYSFGGNDISFVKSFKQNGISEAGLQTAFYQLIALAQRGDTKANSAIKNINQSSLSNQIDHQLNNYTGINIEDLNLDLVGNQSEDNIRKIQPFFFVRGFKHFDKEDIIEAVSIADASIEEMIKNVITKDIIGNQTEGNNFVGSAKSWISEERIFTEEVINTANIGSTAASTPDSENVAPSGVAYTNWNTTSISSAQQNIKNIITDEVNRSTGIVSNAKEQYVRFFVQKGGIESGLGSHPKMNVGSYVGIMQLGVAFIQDALQINKSEATRIWHQVKTNDRLNIQIAIKGNLRLVKELQRLNIFTWSNLYLAHQQGPTGVNDILKAYNSGSGVKDPYGSRMAGNKPPFSNLSSNGTAIDVRRFVEGWKNYVDAGMKTSNPATSPITTTNTALTSNNSLVIPKSKLKDNTEQVTIVEILDGDTIIAKDAKGKEFRVRLASIDAPETGKTFPVKGKSNVNIDGKTYTFTDLIATVPGQEYGEEAKQKLISLLGGKGSSILVDKDAVTNVDVYNRRTANIYRIDGTDINYEMVRSGFAIPTNTRDPRYEKAYQDARSGNQGQFASTSTVMKPSEFIDKIQTPARLKSLEESARARLEAEGKNTSEENLNTTDKVVPTNIAKSNNFRPFRGDYPITYGFGPRNVSTGSKFHKGVDFALPKGVPILAAAPGIARIKHNPPNMTLRKAGFGTYIEITHYNGFVTMYCDLSSVSIQDGATVSYMQEIGRSGNSGSVNKAKNFHLHYEVRYIKGNQLVSINPFSTAPINEIPKGAKPQDYIDPKASQANSGFSRTTQGLFSRRRSIAIRKDGFDSYMEGHQTKKRGVPTEYSVFNEKIQIEKQAEIMSYMQSYHINTAFPVIKAYITVGNENEDISIGKYIRLDQYFEITGIEDVKLVCNDDNNPIDLLYFTIANPSFIRLDNYSIMGHFLTSDYTQLGTNLESQFIGERLTVRPGMKLHIRAGYGNDPNKLKTIFNGFVSELSDDNGYTLNLLCEGFGRELVSYFHSPGKITRAGGAVTNSSSPIVIGGALQADTIAHFGARASFWKAFIGTSTNIITTINPIFQSIRMASWISEKTGLTEAPEKQADTSITGDDRRDPEAKRLTSMISTDSLTLINNSMTNYRQRLYTNIYAAEIEYADSEYKSSFWSYLGNLFSLSRQSGYHYIFQNTTPWEAIKEMEHRHPGTLAKPLMYDDRMTLFYGIKEQLYIARDLDPIFMALANDGVSEALSAEYLKERPKRFDVVTAFHILSTNTNIISNSIGINAKYATGVNVLYFDDVSDFNIDERDEFSIQVDDDIMSWELRYKTIAYNGCHGRYSAWQYGIQELKRQSETMYGGKILLTGNPHIKAGDYAYISDDLRKISGIIKIRECIHHINSRDGFITEIVPGQYVEARDFIYSLLFFKLGFAAQAVLAAADITLKYSANGDEIFNDYKEVLETISEWSSDKSFFDSLTQDGAIVDVGLGTITGLLMYTTSYYSKKRGWYLATNAAVQSAVTFVSASARIGVNSASFIASVKYGEALGKYKTKALDLLKNKATTTVASTKNLSKLQMLTRIALSPITLTARAGMFVLTSPLKMVFNGVTAAIIFKSARGLASLTSAISTLLLSNPVGWFLKIAGTIVLGYVSMKFEEASTTRQPLHFFPLSQCGRPYQAGIRGYKHNTWWESKKNMWNRNIAEVGKAATFIELTSTNSIQKNTSAFIAKRFSNRNEQALETISNAKVIRDGNESQ